MYIVSMQEAPQQPFNFATLDLADPHHHLSGVETLAKLLTLTQRALENVPESSIEKAEKLYDKFGCMKGR